MKLNEEAREACKTAMTREDCQAEALAQCVVGTFRITTQHISPDTFDFAAYNQSGRYMGTAHGLYGLSHHLSCDCGLTPEEIAAVGAALSQRIDDLKAQCERSLEQTLSQELIKIYLKRRFME